MWRADRYFYYSITFEGLNYKEFLKWFYTVDMGVNEMANQEKTHMYFKASDSLRQQSFQKIAGN